MRRTSVVGMLAVTVAACGGGDGPPVVRGDFASGWDPAPDSVRAVRDGSGAPVNGNAFLLEGLSRGTLSLRVLAGGDTVGRMEVDALPAGSRLTLRGVRADPETGLAFPGDVEMDGMDLVRINGLRMAPRARLPREVDAEATVLAASGDGAALLLRPDDARLPDLRVFAGPRAEVVTPDGDPVEADALQRGDSVRVIGRTTSGFVVATRLVVPRRLATRAGTARDDASAEPSAGDRAEEADAGPPARTAPRPSARRDEARGRGESRRGDRGRGRGEERRKGGENGRGRGG